MTYRPFRGDLWFLSNFFPAAVVDRNGWRWPTTEHQFQAAKATTDEDRREIQCAMTPAAAKRRGRLIACRADWMIIRVDVMYHCLRMKFEQHAELADKLVRVDGPIVEWNNWGDTFWGRTEDKGGENVLGQLLERVREEEQARRLTDDNRGLHGGRR